jgi:hypothetical protein
MREITNVNEHSGINPPVVRRKGKMSTPSAHSRCPSILVRIIEIHVTFGFEVNVDQVTGCCDIGWVEKRLKAGRTLRTMT